jgi:hypothetical protein
MRFLRIFLQLVILGTGGIGLAALISQPVPDLTSIFGFFGFVAFLLALTLVLKEQTEERLLTSYKPTFRPLGMALVLLGVFGVFYGLSFIIGDQPMPDGDGTCRAVCGLTLLAAQLFGETVVKFFAFSLWSGVGVFLCLLGYQLGTRRGT